MEFPDLIRQLGRHLRLPSLAVGPGGSCAVRFDDIVVSFTTVPAAGAFDLSARIGRVNLLDPDIAEALEEGRQNVSALHWDKAGDVMLRQRFWLAALSFMDFFRAMERFVNRVDHWRQRLGVR
jgi:hypothetical protein